jgi:hypothetical protein
MAAYGGPQQFAPATGLATAAGVSALTGSQYGPGQFRPGEVTSGLQSFTGPRYCGTIHVALHAAVVTHKRVRNK